MPGVEDLDVRRGHEHETPRRLAVRLGDERALAEPRRVRAPAVEREATAEPVGAAIGRLGTADGPEDAGHARGAVGVQHLASDVGREPGREEGRVEDHRRPARRAVGPAELLHGAVGRHRIDGVAAERGRHVEVEHAGGADPTDEVVRHGPGGLRLRRPSGDLVRQPPHLLERPHPGEATPPARAPSASPRRGATTAP